MTFDEIMAIYNGSSGAATRGLYAMLEDWAPRGTLAVNLLRACKASERAKLYRGGERGRGSYRAMAYEKKDWAVGELCRALAAQEHVIPSWGWGVDPKAIGFEHVLYIDLPGAGQVSFHTSYRRGGSDYAGAWDGITGVAARRICRWTEAVLCGRDATIIEGGARDVLPAGAEGAAAQGDAGGAIRSEERQEALDL